MMTAILGTRRSTVGERCQCRRRDHLRHDRPEIGGIPQEARVIPYRGNTGLTTWTLRGAALMRWDGPDAKPCCSAIKLGQLLKNSALFN